jgi:hypothetical protein
VGRCARHASDLETGIRINSTTDGIVEAINQNCKEWAITSFIPNVLDAKYSLRLVPGPINNNNNSNTKFTINSVLVSLRIILAPHYGFTTTPRFYKKHSQDEEFLDPRFGWIVVDPSLTPEFGLETVSALAISRSSRIKIAGVSGGRVQPY